MPPTTLYVIGNGFDLWHEIPSSYSNFKEFVLEHDNDLFDTIQNYLPLDEKWSDLESSLAGIDVFGILEDLEHFMPSYSAEDWSDAGHHDFQYEVAQVVQGLSTELRALFGKWIRTLKPPTIDTATKRLTCIDVDATYLSFNYTSTLESLYGVPDSHVLHIHGEAQHNDSQLILGHAWNPSHRSSLNDRPDIGDLDTRLAEANAILDRYFGDTFKPSAKLISENQAFFDQLTTIDTVYVLGHSLSDIDHLYYQAILRVPNVASANWYVACLSELDQRRKLDLLISVGVAPSRVDTVLWTDL